MTNKIEIKDSTKEFFDSLHEIRIYFVSGRFAIYHITDHEYGEFSGDLILHDSSNERFAEYYWLEHFDPTMDHACSTMACLNLDNIESIE